MDLHSSLLGSNPSRVCFASRRLRWQPGKAKLNHGRKPVRLLSASNRPRPTGFFVNGERPAIGWVRRHGVVPANGGGATHATETLGSSSATALPRRFRGGSSGPPFIVARAPIEHRASSVIIILVSERRCCWCS